jgi:transposase-like protein
MSCTRTLGKKSDPHCDPQDPPRRRANKRRGHGNYETDRPPIFSVKGRESGQIRYYVRHHADTETCLEVLRAAVGEKVEILNTDEWQGYARVEVTLGIAHMTVRHGPSGKGAREWARDDDGDGIREVHCNGCEGAGAGLRTFLRMFRGVHKKSLAHYVATYEAMTLAKRINAAVIQRMCFVKVFTQSKET